MDNESTQPIAFGVAPDLKPAEHRSLGSHFEWISASSTRVGCVRTLNEDACLELIDRQLWAVADGMGGHKAGDVASRSIVDALTAVPWETNFAHFVDSVEQQILSAHQYLLTLGRSLGQIAGSTVVVLLGHARNALVMWAGDSRAYLLRQGTLQQLTRDHSYVEELLARGEISAADAHSHPEANVITRAVGAGQELYLDMDILELYHGDMLLLCSDGVYKELTEQQINAIMSHGYSPSAIVQEMINACIEHGARDNVSAVVVKVVERV